MMQNSETQIFVAAAEDTVAGLRMDQILSFIYHEPEKSLIIRFVGGGAPETFKGPMAEALLRELRYAGRK